MEAIRPEVQEQIVNILTQLEIYLRQQTQVNNLVENLKWITPIVLSVVAIIISICVTIKQNKIALFEKRYVLYSLIKRAGNCSMMNNPKDELWNKLLLKKDEIKFLFGKDVLEYVNLLEKKTLELAKAKYWFERKENEENENRLNEILEWFNKEMTNKFENRFKKYMKF